MGGSSRWEILNLNFLLRIFGPLGRLTWTVSARGVSPPTAVVTLWVLPTTLTSLTWDKWGETYDRPFFFSFTNRIPPSRYFPQWEKIVTDWATVCWLLQKNYTYSRQGFVTGIYFFFHSFYQGFASTKLYQLHLNERRRQFLRVSHPRGLRGEGLSHIFLLFLILPSTGFLQLPLQDVQKPTWPSKTVARKSTTNFLLTLPIVCLW